MPKPPPDSPAIRVLRAVWEGANPFPSWRIINGAMHSALKTCISAQIKFGEDDFSVMSRDFRSGYWIGTGWDQGPIYGLAIKSSNNTCWKAIESYRSRPPFLLQGKRIYAGYKFQWGCLAVTCTSLDRDNLIACSYKWEMVPGYCAFCEPDGRKTYKVDRRITITRESLREENKRLKSMSGTRHKENEMEKSA
jgi:hypothetical protein